MKRQYKRTNDILEDHGSWLLVDISTQRFAGATMAVDCDVWHGREGGRVRPILGTGSRYIHAVCDINGKPRLFHHQVVNVQSGLAVDHVAHGTMRHIDNRRTNLRLATASQNQMNTGKMSSNTSGIVGVAWCSFAQKWRAEIQINGKCKSLGHFDNIDFAIGARQQAERELFGEYAFRPS